MTASSFTPLTSVCVADDKSLLHIARFATEQFGSWFNPLHFYLGIDGFALRGFAKDLMRASTGKTKVTLTANELQAYGATTLRTDIEARRDAVNMYRDFGTFPAVVLNKLCVYKQSERPSLTIDQTEHLIDMLVTAALEVHSGNAYIIDKATTMSFFTKLMIKSNRSRVLRMIYDGDIQNEQVQERDRAAFEIVRTDTNAGQVSWSIDTKVRRSTNPEIHRNRSRGSLLRYVKRLAG